MKILSKMRKQQAVYWAPVLGTDGLCVLDAYGEKTFAAPVQMRVRWEGAQFWDRNVGLLLDETTKEVIYLGCPVLKGGLLWKGCLKNLPTIPAEGPRALNGAWEVQKYSEYPMLNPRKGVLRVAQL